MEGMEPGTSMVNYGTATSPSDGEREQPVPNFVSALDEILKHGQRTNSVTSQNDSQNQNLRSPTELFCSAPSTSQRIALESTSVPERKFAFFQYFYGPSYSVYESLGRLYLSYLVLPVAIAIVLQVAPCISSSKIIDIGASVKENMNEASRGVRPTITPKTNWSMGSLAIINTISAIFFVDKWRNLLQETNLKLIAKSIHAGTFSISRFDLIQDQSRNESSLASWWELTGKKYVVALPLTVLLALIDVYCIYRVIHLWVEGDHPDDDERSWLIYHVLPYPNRKILIGVVILWTITWLFVEMARLLTIWENPQCHSDYVSSLVGKIAFFAFVVNFSPIHYIHCFLKNIEKTRIFVLTLLMVFAVLDIVNDLLCCLRRRRRNAAWSSNDAGTNESDIDGDNDIYQDNVNLFLPLFIQIGLVFMFSTAVPSALLLSFFFNLLSLPLKAYRIQSLSSNEILQTSLEAMQWQDVLCMLLALALLANCHALNEAAAVTDLQHNLGSLFAWSILLLHIFMIVGVVVVIMPDNNMAKEAAMIRKTYREIKASTRIPSDSTKESRYSPEDVPHQLQDEQVSDTSSNLFHSSLNPNTETPLTRETSVEEKTN